MFFNSNIENKFVSTTVAERDFNVSQSSSVYSRNEFFYIVSCGIAAMMRIPLILALAEIMEMIVALPSQKMWRFGWILQMTCCIW